MSLTNWVLSWWIPGMSDFFWQSTFYLEAYAFSLIFDRQTIHGSSLFLFILSESLSLTHSTLLSCRWISACVLNKQRSCSTFSGLYLSVLVAKYFPVREWWHAPALGRPGQDGQFEANLCYIARHLFLNTFKTKSKSFPATGSKSLSKFTLQQTQS